MKFCPKCGSIMVSKTENGKKLFVCRKCGYREPVGDRKVLAKAQIKTNPSRDVVIIEKDYVKEALPRTKVTCPSCGHGEAYYYTMQTRSADEPTTRFYICAKCGYRWREYQ